MSFDVVFDGDTHLVVKDGVHKYGYAVLGQDLKTYSGESFFGIFLQIR